MTTATTHDTTAAFVMPFGEKFSCVIDDTKIGTSKHQDYFEYHYKRGDIKGLKALDIKTFVYLDKEGKVDHVVDAKKSKRETAATVAANMALEEQAKQAVAVMAAITAEAAKPAAKAETTTAEPTAKAETTTAEPTADSATPATTEADPAAPAVVESQPAGKSKKSH